MKNKSSQKFAFKKVIFATIIITSIITTIVVAIWMLLPQIYPKPMKQLSEVKFSSVITPVKEQNSSNLMRHLYYQEADQNDLIIIASYAQQQYQRFEYLDREAAKALMKLIYAARDQGVWIVPVSGFRSIERQKIIFDDQIARLGSVEAASKVSAPPGYSEHHSSYAVDLGDGRFPKQDITNAFVDTDAYLWLNQHAKEYGFEMSFPLNNSQGVMFEPWHWRFIGSSRAATIFSKVTDSK
jgi:zinc D-Ala-D-Ala carboxypeptidase